MTTAAALVSEGDGFIRGVWEQPPRFGFAKDLRAQWVGQKNQYSNSGNGEKDKTNGKVNFFHAFQSLSQGLPAVPFHFDFHAYESIRDSTFVRRNNQGNAVSVTSHLMPFFSSFSGFFLRFFTVPHKPLDPY